MNMGRWRLAILVAGAAVCLSVAPAAAQKWIVYANPDGGWSVDAESMIADGQQKATPEILIYSPTPREIHGKHFNYSDTLVTFDCVAATYRPRKTSYLDADGNEVDHVTIPDDAPLQPLPGGDGVLARIAGAACHGTELPPGTAQADDLAGAVRALKAR